MQYISPVKLFREELNGRAELSIRELSLIKRSLLAEAELSEGKIVVRDGIEFSKEDIIRLFDQLEKDGRLDYHLRIFKNEKLLNFLETGEYDFADTPPDTTEIKENNEFRLFIQPWFIPVWQNALLSELRLRNFHDMLVLINLGKDIIDEVVLTEALQPLESKLLDLEYNANQLMRHIETTKRINDEEIDEYMNVYLIMFLNELPYTFGSFRNSYMIAMVNITVNIFNAGQPQLALSYLTTAAELDCDPYYKNLAAERLELYKSRRSNRRVFGSGGRSYYWWIGSLIYLLVRVATCNNSSPSYSNNGFQTFNTVPSTPYIPPPTTYGGTSLDLPERQVIYLSKNDDAVSFLLPDSDCISIATLNNGNTVFLYHLIKELRKNVADLPAAKYPEKGLKHYGININSLQSFIDSNWKKDLEYDVNGQKAVLIAYNETRTPMLLLYKTGPDLLAKQLEPGAQLTLKLQPGRAALIPFLGTGWNRNKKIVSVTNDKEIVLSNGWFTGNTDSSGSLQKNVSLFQVTAKSAVSDTIIYYYRPEDGYYGIMRARNLKHFATKTISNPY